MNSITQTAPQSNTAVQFVLTDGVHPFDDPVDQYCVVVAGQIVNYATHFSTACAQYREATRIRREHFRTNPGEAF